MLPKKLKSLPKWILANKFFFKDLKNDDPMMLTSPNEANLVSSYLCDQGSIAYHIPVLDIDMPCALLPSSTPGHHHLLIDKVMSAEKYDKLLRVLNEVGIIGDGIIEHQWEKEGLTAIRLPGIVKEPGDKGSGSNPAYSDVSIHTIGSDITLPEATVNPAVSEAPQPFYSISLPEAIDEAKLLSALGLDPVISKSPETSVFDIVERLAKIASETGISIKTITEVWKEIKS